MNWFELMFPGLRSCQYLVTSPATPCYNCIAWSAEDDSRWWWPDPFGQGYWPIDAPRELSIQAFIKAYSLDGYETCKDGVLESGFQKIAIFVDSNMLPTHAARQLPSGAWTSKLGPQEDIEHESVNGVAGNVYGVVQQYMKRLSDDFGIPQANVPGTLKRLWKWLIGLLSK